MGAARERLISMVRDDDRFTHSHAELRDTQLAAVDELLQERRDRIRLLGHRAKEAGITSVGSREEIVPLLFPHTAYKSYPESFLAEQKWDRLGKWLGTISPHPIADIDISDIVDMDDWLERLEAKGNFVSCSSGTTGKASMLIASQADMDWTRRDTVGVFQWGAGVDPARDRRFFRCAPMAHAPKNTVTGEAQYDAFGDPAIPVWKFPVTPITIGRQTQMIVLRKAIAEGTAMPEQIAAYEETAKEREQEIENAYVATAEAIVAGRTDKLYLAGMWAALFKISTIVREMGFTGKDFHPDNCIYVGGGLKRALLPDDYREYVFETFNIPAEHHFQNYSMQELNSGMPRCRVGGRYHVPPWIIPMVLDHDGDRLLPHSSGALEGRAGFVDLALDGRWNGVITGDRITLDLDPCPCGSASPSILDNVVRYADIQGDDKIGCAGTVDAYVRGMA